MISYGGIDDVRGVINASVWMGSGPSVTGDEDMTTTWQLLY